MENIESEAITWDEETLPCRILQLIFYPERYDIARFLSRRKGHQ